MRHVERGGEATPASRDSTESAGKVVGEVTVDEYQLTGYAKIGIHQVMLTDSVRTRAYRTAILGNIELFNNKVVLDIGAGTGILSYFAAEAGAKHVYAIEYHESLAARVRDTAKRNGLADRITVFSGKAEDLDLPVDTVDIIVSEWMGYALLYESMLDTVLYARDRWLAEDGILLPDRAHLYVTASSDRINFENRSNFFNDVYGYDMGGFSELLLREASIGTVYPENVRTYPTLVRSWDLRTCKLEDLVFKTDFVLRANGDGTVHMVDFWFETDFSHGKKKVQLSTSPFHLETHWQQTHFYVNEPIPLVDDEEMHGTIDWKRKPGLHREQIIGITLRDVAEGKTKDMVNQYAIEF